MEIIRVDHPFYGLVSGFAADEIIFAHIQKGLIWEPNIVEAFEAHIRPGSTCLDVGANIGLHTIAMRIVESTATVISFEPNPYIFPVLHENLILDSMVTLKQIGLGKRKADLFARSIKGSNNPGGASLFDYQMDSSSSEPDLKVDVLPLDSLNIDDISVIKVDVEGMEMEVLLGGKKTIKRQRPALIIEIWDLDNPKLRLKKIRRIERFGYKFKMLSPVDFLFTPK